MLREIKLFVQRQATFKWQTEEKPGFLAYAFCALPSTKKYTVLPENEKIVSPRSHTGTLAVKVDLI